MRKLYRRFITVLAVALLLPPAASWSGPPRPPEADYPQILYLYPDGDQVHFLTEYGGYLQGATPRFRAVYDLKDGRMTLEHTDGDYQGDKDYYRANASAIQEYFKSHQKNCEANKSVAFKNGRVLYVKTIAQVVPKLTLAEAKELYQHYCFKLEPGEEQYDDLGKYISSGEIANTLSGPYVVKDDLFYAGLNGSQSEGSGGFGGLVIFDAGSRKVRIERIPELNCGSVQFMEPYKDQLVILTVVGGEGSVGPGGYFLCDPVKGTCQNLDPRGLFKEATVQNAILYRDKLFLSMDKGLGVIDLENLKGQFWEWAIELKEKAVGK